MKRSKLVNYLDDYLRISEIADYGPQGLQVEADNEAIARIALSVDAAPAVIEAAAAWKADMLLVHHGILWRDVERIAGPLGKRVCLLLQHRINLYAAHLPLDAHPEVGNNAVLARMLGVEVDEWWCAPKGTPIGVLGKMTTDVTVDELVRQINERLNTKARVLAYGPEQVNTLGIISGFGADEVAAASALGADTLLTGETSHAHYWAAADHGMNVIYAGHYATETVGVQALGRHLTDKFGVETKFLDFPTAM
ncbi:MAG TPA: Nif3-like dinuclear metal center hexameric protein [Anaerolineae bacterium]